MSQSFEFEELELKGAYLIKPFISEDIRGKFIKDYSKKIFNENNIAHNLKETFYTISKRGVIRAIHFQEVKQQAKLVRCLKGKVYDVIVDLRPESPTFKKWLGFYLSDQNNYELLVPEYFGHGYLVLEESIVSYKCAERFYGEYDRGIIWNDKNINITWPIEEIGGIEKLVLSEKDKELGTFEDFINENKIS
ncbi:MAG: dTDP-4-dehydrorhamnose 3,5-epimerase [Erysipelotrichaceae bacterium]